jgi:hypothetical protein
MSPSTARLIVSADDLGMAPPITNAIIDCHLGGIVTSTNLMANMPGAAHAARRVGETPRLDVGLHLNLTEGAPVSAPERIAKLLGPNGEFLPKELQMQRFASDERMVDQVARELEAQICRALELGVRPTHCNSHHGIQRAAVVHRALLDVLPRFGMVRTRTQLAPHWAARRAGLWARTACISRNLREAGETFGYWRARGMLRRAGILTPDRKISPAMLHPRSADPRQQLLVCLANLPRGTSELVLHPGYLAPEVQGASGFAAVRVRDTAMARDPEVIGVIERSGIQLISYRDL